MLYNDFKGGSMTTTLTAAFSLVASCRVAPGTEARATAAVGRRVAARAGPLSRAGATRG